VANCHNAAAAKRSGLTQALGLTVSQRRNWSHFFLKASLVPSGLLIAFIAWFMLWHRPSGQEQWGDGAAIFYLGVLAYPLSILLLVIGTVLAVRHRRRHPSEPTAGPLLFAASLGLLAAPWLLLLLPAM
jgi:hypothetical protein